MHILYSGLLREQSYTPQFSCASALLVEIKFPLLWQQKNLYSQYDYWTKIFKINSFPRIQKFLTCLLLYYLSFNLDFLAHINQLNVVSASQITISLLVRCQVSGVKCKVSDVTKLYIYIYIS